MSKLLYFLIQPLNWIIGLLLYAVFTKNAKRKKRFRNIALVLLIFFTNHFLFNLVMRGWETDVYSHTQLEETYDIGIVLGGYTNFNILATDRYNFSERGSRLTQAVELYKLGKVKKLLLTGGSGALLENMPSEAEQILRFLKTIGIPDSDIIIEPDSRNTYENAIFTKKILNEKYPNASCLLITSAFHMRRSKGCFRKAGVTFTPYSTDVIGEKIRFTPATLFMPNRDGFYRWGAMIKEWIGYVVYDLRGYI